MTQTEPRFIPLRVHSSYSLLEGAIPLKSLPKLVAGAQFPAVAVTDRNNLFGALEFSESCARAGIQPIIGLELAVCYQEKPPLGERRAEPAFLALYAQNRRGYENLMALSSAAWLETDAMQTAQIGLSRLGAHAEGVICLTGGSLGPLGQLIASRQISAAEDVLRKLASMFGDRLYVEIQRHGPGQSLRTQAEAMTEPAMIALAYDLELPLVATNSTYFPTPDMFEAHDALICIGEGRYINEENRRRLTPEHYFKSAQEMAARFADLPEALENTVEIARRCAYRPRTHAPILPVFAENEVAELHRQAHEGLRARLAVIPPAATTDVYAQRLEYELGVIESMGFPGYFLIVADFIKWAKEQGIPVGPGRGSGAGSLVAYALTITDLDPLRYNLLFERFLNPERVSMPDFDIDFCQDRREEVIAYVQQKYGTDRVAQIITFGALLSKAAVRDVGRVLQMPYSQVDRLAKLIPVEGVKPVSIAQARTDEPRLNEAARKEDVVATLLDYAQKLEGLLRNASTHAAGVVIGDRPLVELVPLYRDPKSSMPATQFNMKWVEPAGLVKFDFLGLKTLTVIRNCIDLLAVRGIDIDISAIPLDDAKAYDLYARADTVGVFQVESAGMRDALRQMRPTCIEDIVALVALYRPGPMENIPKFCNVKNGREAREYLHPTIDAILDETQGIIVYQEQVMEIARKMAGYSLGGADLLRRAMGKKIQEAMDAEKPKFLAGAAANNVSQEKAQEVWDLLNKFANYGFNKSHAAAYALVSYQTAWLKANYPVEFMAAVMNLDLHLTDKLNVYVQECRRSGIAITPPCINRSDARFSVKDGQILYALGALKNVGTDAMRQIVAARDRNGEFRDLFDFAKRVDLRHTGRRALENLARAGAFDALDPNRNRVLKSLDALIDYSVTMQAEASSNQVSLFAGNDGGLPPPRLARAEDWLPSERLGHEHAAIGFYLSGHPLDNYIPALRRKRITTLAEYMAGPGRIGGNGRIAGTLSIRRERKSARGTRFAFIQFSDPDGLWEVMAFADILQECDAVLQPGNNVVCTVQADTSDEQSRLMLRAAQMVDDVTADAAANGLRIWLRDAAGLSAIRARLDHAAAQGQSTRSQGPIDLVIALEDEDMAVEMTLPGRYAINPDICGALNATPGVLRLEYI